jgi:hypothetical protein
MVLFSRLPFNGVLRGVWRACHRPKKPSGLKEPQGLVAEEVSDALRHGYGAYTDNHGGAEVGLSFTEKDVTERRINVGHPHRSWSFRRPKAFRPRK